MKQAWFRSDWFAALAFALVFAILAYGVLGTAFQSIERSAYDLGVRERSRTPSDRVAVIAIDDQSVQNLGRWPWPRTLHAQLVDKLRAGGAKLVASTVFYSEAEQDNGSQVIDDLAKTLQNSPLTQQIPAEIDSFNVMLQDTAQHDRAVAGIAKAYRESSLANDYSKSIEALSAKLADARKRLAADNSLAQALGAAGNVLLPMSFELGPPPQGRPDKPLPDYVSRYALAHIVDRVDARARGALPFTTTDANTQLPVPELGAAAAGIGTLDTVVDLDGGVRQEPLVLQHYDEFYPSLSLLVAAQALNLKPADIEVRLGEGVALGGLSIATDPHLRMYTHFYADRDGRPAFPVDSFYDVYAGKIPVEKYKGKIVLIGATARGVGSSFPTPVSPAMAPVLTMAHTVSSLLQQDFYTRPAWAHWAELALYPLLAAYLALALPKLPAVTAALLTAGLAVALLVAEFVLMTGSAMWLRLTTPALLLVFGHLFMTVKKFRITEKLKQSSDAESSESNKMLGLAFQGQGQLDMAFDKFKRVEPVDDRLLDLMYNLALDFERKRQFNKSGAVYEFIAKHNPKFKDVQDKVSRSKKMESTIILGGSGGRSTAGGTLIMGDATVEKPMLGRYQVERELGKGAMGVVYLGKDPKIGRMVAIKTMALSQEFEADELAEVKARFFREAETAGRLQHPNIVSIYDAGEEHDLAYIAMEFIKGYDLVRHTKPNALLEIPEVLKIVADAADALDYAHSQGVVHRDIKPANMMWLADTKIIKVTDFGIARITDSSKTKTGMVLGTPSYMSPEQLSGKKVDGRSDLFSLGVTLYQLLTGALPFQADSMATLMFKIANEPQAPVLTLRPDLPPAIEAIISRALQKQLETRYAAGREFARDLRGLLH